MARVAEAAHTALGELRRGDRVAVMAFDEFAELMVDFTGDFAIAEKSIGERVLPRAPRCCTRIQAALAEAARHFEGQPANAARRAIIVVTDDEGTPGRCANYGKPTQSFWVSSSTRRG